MELEEIFKEKKFGEKTSNFLKQAINETIQVFKGNLSEKEILSRINDNIENIEFVDNIFDRKQSLGAYFSKKIVILKDLDENQQHSVFFHEFTHAVIGTIYNYLYSDKPAIGLTEGITEMLTKRRNKLVGFDDNKIYTYPVLAKQCENLLLILGEDKTISTLAKDINKIKDLMIEKGIIDDELEFDNYVDSMDYIAKYEKDIFKKKLNNSENKDNDIVQLIFGKKKLPNDVTKAQTNIIMTHLKIDSTSVDEYNNKVNIAKQYAKELAIDDNGKIFVSLYNEFKKHHYDINKVDPIIIKTGYEMEFIEKYLANSEKQRFVQLANDTKLLKTVNESQFSDYYKKLICNNININIADKNYLFNILTNGLAEKIVNENLTPETIGIETVSKDEYYNIYNLYISNGSDRKYIGTYNVQNYDENCIKYNLISDENELKKTVNLLEKAYQSNLEEEITHEPTCINNSSLILKNESENDYLVSNSDGSWWNIIYDSEEDFYDEMKLTAHTQYNLSYVESKLVSANWRLQNCLNLDTNMKSDLIDMEIKNINKILNKYSEKEQDIFSNDFSNFVKNIDDSQNNNVFRQENNNER